MRNWLKSGSTASQNATVWSAIKAGTRVHVRMIFTDQNITLEDQDISLDSGLVVNDIFNGDTDLVFGKTVCKQINVRILNSNRLDGLSWTGEFKLQMWVEISSVEYTCDIGYFTGEKPRNVTTARYIDFTAYDRMKRFDELADGFLESLTYPRETRWIFRSLVQSVGLSGQLDNVPQTISGRSFASAPTDIKGYTKRDILGWIAEQCGSYAVITPDGACKLKWFQNTWDHSITPTEEFRVESADLNPGLTWNQFDALSNAEQEAMTCNDIAGYKEAYAVERMMVNQVDSDFTVNYPSAVGENVYAIVDNPFVIVSSWDDVTNYVKPLFDRLATFGGYLPFSMECIGDPAVEAGDVITVDINGTTLTVPVFVKAMRWNGGITDIYEATGQIPRSAYGTNANKQTVMNSNSIKMFVRNQYYDRKSGIEITDEGVVMDGSTFVDIKSGSRIDIESGGEINVKSGGSLEVQSGGNIDINATGTLDLTGSTVRIRSGSTFDVDSTNFKIESATKLMQCGNWKLTDTGVVYVDPTEQLETFEIKKGYPSNTDRSGIYHELWTSSLGKKYGYLYFLISGDLGSGYKSARIQHTMSEMTGETNPQLLTDAPSSFVCDWYIGRNSNITLYANVVNYNSLVQRSSREIKHNINPLPSIGERLDQLKPISFVYDDDKHEKTHWGLIYEDTQEVMPEVCTKDEDNKAINYIELVPALLKEIQDLRKRVAELERRD